MIAVLAGLLLLADLVVLGRPPEQQAASGPASTGVCLGIVIAAALLYYSVQNLRALTVARRLGADL